MCKNLLFRHCTLGLPVYPIGQVQLDACNLDLQMAFDPQRSTKHASRHDPSKHLCESGQSLSDKQLGLGVTENKNKFDRDFWIWGIT